MSEKEKIISGERYLAWDDQLVEKSLNARRLMREFIA
ncbi:maltose acetyltransferase domain-containing protein [Gottfriedia acidiceleris]|nr:maltose acetyltransferase domain-containing protein [Bacillus sp. AFS001701]